MFVCERTCVRVSVIYTSQWHFLVHFLVTLPYIVRTQKKQLICPSVLNHKINIFGNKLTCLF